jgi:ubiquinone biosynthesis protein
MRLAHLGIVLLRHAIGYSIGQRLHRWPRLAGQLPSTTLSGPERLRAIIEDAGGTFIKFGQMLALQPDILPFEYCRELTNLLDRISPFSYDEVERTFVEELGRTPRAIFDSFDEHPLATASIGQVHVASLKGRRFAVKVQRPSVERDFAGDVRLMTTLLSIIKLLRFRPLYWLIEPTSEFVAWTREELDYRCEARYLDQMRRNAQDNSFERVPEVLAACTTRRILVTELFESVTVLDHLRSVEAHDEAMHQRLESIAFEPNQFACHIIDNFLNDAYKYGLFHADLHPANLMILPNNVVGYIDFGITGVLSRFSRANLVSLTLAYTRGDINGMSAAFLKGAALGTKADPESFRQRLRVLSNQWYEMFGHERRLRKNFTLVMLDMLRLSRQTDIWPERDVVKYIRSAIAIDGLITRFAPAFNVGRYLETVCDRYLTWEKRRALFSYDSVINWSLANSQLMSDGVFRTARLIRRIAEGEWPELSGEGQKNKWTAFAARTVQLSVVIIAISTAMIVSDMTTNDRDFLFKAGALVISAVAIILLQTSRKLV